MENSNVVIIMLKDSKTGQLEKELGVYSVDAEQVNIFSVSALKDDGNITINICLTLDKEIEDWEYDAIFDYYDDTIFKKIDVLVKEEDGHLNPVWEFSFSYEDDIRYVENKLVEVINLHNKELVSVYEAIRDKRNDYIEL